MNQAVAFQPTDQLFARLHEITMEMKSPKTAITTPLADAFVGTLEEIALHKPGAFKARKHEFAQAVGGVVRSLPSKDRTGFAEHLEKDYPKVFGVVAEEYGIA